MMFSKAARKTCKKSVEPVKPLTVGLSPRKKDKGRVIWVVRGGCQHGRAHARLPSALLRLAHHLSLS